MVRFWGPVAALLVAAVLALHAVTPASAQQWAMPGADRIFRVEWEPATTKRGPVLRGYVWNDHGQAAGNIRLFIESLDPTGAVAATTVGYVLGVVGPSDRLYFEVKLAAPATNYRVRVGSWEPQGRGGP
jgi:hypothetical protein